MAEVGETETGREWPGLGHCRSFIPYAVVAAPSYSSKTSSFDRNLVPAILLENLLHGLGGFLAVDSDRYGDAAV